MRVFDSPPAPAVPLPGQPPEVLWPTAGWTKGDLADHVEADRLAALVDGAFPDPDGSPLGASLALVVVHRGELVLERYGATAGPDTELISWSMGKSFVHALVGILTKEQRLDPARPLGVPEWSAAGDLRNTITLDHLLRMVGGTEFIEDYVDEQASHCIEMLFGDGAEDMGAYAATLPSIARPDEVFNYSSGTTNIITRALAEMVGSGPTFDSWMRDVLLGPLGMDSARLTFDGAGTWVGSSFLHATARDFAKFGLLYLRDGLWEGRRLLPEGWVDYARTAQAVGDEGELYGAHWWIWDHDHDVFACQGYETQRILLDPATDVVLVRLGKTPSEKAEAVDEWLKEVLGCFRTKGATPVD